MLLISHATANTVEIFDPKKRRVIGKVTHMSQPHGIAVDEENGRAYIANSGANNLVVLSTSDFQVQRTIALPFSPRALLYVPKTKLVYVVCAEQQRLLTVDPQLGTTTHTVETQGHPESLAFDPGRDLVYVTLQDQKKIQAYGATALEPGKSFDLQGSMPTGLVYDQQLDRLYVAVRNAVLALDAKTGSEVGRVAAPTGTDRLWLDPESRTLLAVSYGAVALMHAGDRLAAVDELPIDVKGHAFAFDAKTGLLLPARWTRRPIKAAHPETSVHRRTEAAAGSRVVRPQALTAQLGGSRSLRQRWYCSSLTCSIQSTTLPSSFS